MTSVHDIDLYFPGHVASTLGTQTTWAGHTVKMTANDIQTICDTDPVNVAAGHHIVFGSGFTVPRPSSLALRVGGPTGLCRAHTVTGPLPPWRIRRAATVRSHLRLGTATRGHTQVHVSRALPPGAHRLKLTELFQRVGAGAQHRNATSLPVTVSAQTGT